MRNRRQKGRGKLVLYVSLAVIGALLLGVAFYYRALLQQKPTEIFGSVSHVRFVEGGGELVVDDGQTTLFLLDADGGIVRRYDGGDINSPFFYACHAVAASDGSIYVADIVYGSRGALLEQERIIKLGEDGRSVVYAEDYTGLPEKNIPLQNGLILELQEHEGQIYFTKRSGGTVTVYRLNERDEPEEVGHASISGTLNDASYDPATGFLFVSTRKGLILRADLKTGVVHNLSGQARLPMDIAARNGQIYYVDPYNKTVWHRSLDGKRENEEFYRFETIPRKLDVSADGRNLLVTDGEIFYRLTGDENYHCADAEAVSAAEISFFSRVLAVWAALILGAAVAAFFLCKLLLKLIFVITHNETALRVLLIMLASMGVAFVLSYSLLNQILAGNLSASTEKASMFAEILMSKVDVDALLSIQKPEDSDTQAFKEMKQELDAHVWASYSNGDYYYYLIWRRNGDVISCIMDFEGVHPSWEPSYEYGDNIYTDVLETGEGAASSEISSYGAWTFVLVPILDEGGNVVAELEVGQDLNELRRSQNRLQQELLVNVMISSIVVTMLLLELTFLLRSLENKASEGLKDPTEQVPLRTLMFLSYVADSMQDTFIAVLLSELYDGSLPVSDGIAIALPMSLQLFAMAVFSLLGGRFAERHGVRQGLTVGFSVQCAGFVTCLLTGNFLGILIGKIFIGVGMGVVYVSCNTAASMGRDEAHTETAFADVSAGILSGITIGAGLSSVLLSMGGYRLIYLTGAILLSMGLALAFFYTPHTRMGWGLSNRRRHPVREKQRKPSGGMSAFQFLTSRRIAAYFLFLLLPFMMSMSYREYFFPLYASESWLSETRIGQIYLLCGLMGLYIGPALSAWILRRFGPKRAIIMASSLIVANLALFILHPFLSGVIAGVFILSFVVSFSSTCQYAYFDTLDEIREYGSGAALGIYSMTESLGSTLGPMLYGVLLSFGYREGIAAFAVLMSAALVLFVALSGRRKPRPEETAEQLLKTAEELVKKAASEPAPQPVKQDTVPDETEQEPLDYLQIIQEFRTQA
ncbi:MAG: MFS transporter [Oscillibacter sp.]|nr:MFS transporter [Oscillibacter sp.]